MLFYVRTSTGVIKHLSKYRELLISLLFLLRVSDKAFHIQNASAYDSQFKGRMQGIAEANAVPTANTDIAIYIVWSDFSCQL